MDSLSDKKRFTSGFRQEEDAPLEKSLRPQSLNDFLGQEKLKNKLRVYLEAAKSRSEQLDHALFHGPPGIGKTTLAHIIATEMGTNLTATSGQILEKPGDLVGILSRMSKGDVLFIDEIHRMNRTVEEYLYSAMEDWFLDVVINQGPAAQTVRINLEPFTLVGSTTRAGMLSAPLRSRFGITERLSYYTDDELTLIVERSASVLNVTVESSASLKIAQRSRGTPRVAIRVLRRVRDFAQVYGKPSVDEEITEKALDILDIDKEGLDETDKLILQTIIEKFSGGPVGITTIAVANSEDNETIEELYEPYLVQKGFLMRTTRGRMTTEHALRHLGYTKNNNISGFCEPDGLF